MPKNFCFCIGGTGARVAEVAAHVCAMNLAGEDDVEFIIVDKDSNCGGTAQAKRVIESVGALSDTESPYGLMFTNAARAFCKSKLTVNTWDFNETLNGIAGTRTESSLKDTVVDATRSIDDQVLFDAFYSKSEQDTDTAKGFYGHPSIGALLFKHMVKKANWLNTTDGKDIAASIKQYFISGGDYARIFVIGSIFGGTGASTFPNLAAYLRAALAPWSNRVFISGSLLLPYFIVPQGGINARIKTEEFISKSVVALEQYSMDSNLIRDAEHRNNSFDSIYICGQEPGHAISPNYSEGGQDQINHMDIVDFAAALAMAEFFRKEWVDEQTTGVIFDGNVYEYRLDTGAASDGNAIIDMDSNMNNTNSEPRKNVVAMLSFCTFILTHPIADMVLQPDDPSNNNTVNTLFGKPGLMQKKQFNEAYVNEHRGQLISICDRMYDFCKSYVRFACDMAYVGRDWSGNGTSDYSNQYALIDKQYINNLERLFGLIDAYNANQTKANYVSIQNWVANLMNTTGIIPGNNYGPSSKETENALNAIFASRLSDYNSKQVDARHRIGDYFHEAYAYCFSKS